MGRTTIYNKITNEESIKKINPNNKQLCEDFLEYLASIDRAPSTINGYRNVMASLMENFDVARQALDVSMNSEGSAMQEHEKYMDSIEARVNQLKAAWEGLSNSFLDSGFVKGVVSGLTEIAEAITTVIDHIGALGTIGAGVGIVALIKNFGKEFALYGCESIDA